MIYDYPHTHYYGNDQEDNLENIKEFIDGYLNKFATGGGYMNASRIFRDFSFSNTASKPWYDDSRPNYNRMQGGAYDADAQKYFIVYWDNGNTDNVDKLVRYSATGDIEKEVELTGGWCNGLTVDEDFVYVCVRGVSGPTYVNDIKVYDKDLNYIRTGYSSIHLKSLSYFDGQLYGMDEALNIYKVNKANFYVDPEPIFTDLGLIGNVQNFAIYDKFIYFIVSKPNYFIVYNMETELVTYYIVPNRLDERYIAGELQWLSVDGKTVKFGGTCSIWNLAQLQQVYETCLLDGYPIKNSYVSTYQRANTIYVDSDATGTNPTGTASNPYKYLEEATACGGGDYSIYFKGVHKVLYVSTDNFVDVNAWGDGQADIQHGVYVRRTSNFMMIDSNINITNHIYRDAAIVIENTASAIIRVGDVSSDSTYLLYSDSSDTVFNCSTVDGSLTPNRIYNHYGTVKTLKKQLSIDNSYFTLNYTRLNIATNDSVLEGELTVDVNNLAVARAKNALMLFTFYGAGEDYVTSQIVPFNNKIKLGIDRVLSSSTTTATCRLDLTNTGITISNNYCRVGSTGHNEEDWDTNYRVHLISVDVLI